MFWTKNFLAPKFFGPNIFWTKNYYDLKFLGPKICRQRFLKSFDPNIFGPRIFFTPNLFLKAQIKKDPSRSLKNLVLSFRLKCLQEYILVFSLIYISSAVESTMKHILKYLLIVSSTEDDPRNKCINFVQFSSITAGILPIQSLPVGGWLWQVGSHNHVKPNL